MGFLQIRIVKYLTVQLAQLIEEKGKHYHTI